MLQDKFTQTAQATWDATLNIVLQKYAHIGLKQNLLRLTTPWGAQSKVRGYTMLVPIDENVTLFSDFWFEIFDPFLWHGFWKVTFPLRLEKI